jgi:small GTP-binding protein
MTDEELLKKILRAAANKMISLDLSRMGITALPPEIFQVTDLTLLDLSNNQLTALPPEIFRLTNLEALDLRNNQLTSLPPEIFQLSGLTQLDFSGNRLTALPQELFRLKNLTELYLWANQLTVLPSEICQLAGLEALDLSGNHITKLPYKLFQLTKLQSLDLSGNRLSALSPEICQLSKLTEFNLSHNQLSYLPMEIVQLTNLSDLGLDDNPLSTPPLEIAEQGIEAIRQYFAALEKEEHPLNEVKTLLVGDGAAGKTSLVKRLLGQVFDPHEDTTHGINIRGWEVEAGDKALRVNLWDFGGQEIMHATHQFFLSKRSLYVLVLDGRRDERPEYWLRHIESFGGDSPVLIVLNKQDANPGFDLNRPFLLRKYPAIRGFLLISCADGRGIDRFREVLLKELARVEMTGIRWPGSWFRVKERIEKMDRPYISCDEYGGICAEAGIAEQESREVLVGFLHDMGVAVHFKDFVLDGTHVLDPVWVTTAVYKIINAEQVAADKGVLRLNSLGVILRQEDGEEYDYPASTHSYIIELMKKFQLCWSIGREAVLIPQLLGVVEPEFSFDEAGALRFVLHYHDLLPLSVLPRFIVKRHREIRGGLCWRTGVVLRDQESGSEAVVRADYESRRISLWVNGPRRKEYLTFLWFSLREINDSFETLNVSARVPMPDDPHRTADYETLLKHAKRGSDIYYAEGSDREYSVRELLGLVQPEGEGEVLELVRMIKAQMDEKDSGTEVLNSLFKLEPSILGVGVNLNEAFKRILAYAKHKDGQG